MIPFQLQFDPAEIPSLAAQFDYPQDEAFFKEMRPNVDQRGYFTKAEFLKVCEWKTMRSKSLVDQNSESDIAAITKVCLSTDNERLRIGSLLLLDGVQFPTASVVLHFFHRNQYPILDFRALAALGFAKTPTYTFEFWNAYVAYTRTLAEQHKVDMRTLDKALWQWSKNKNK